MRKRLFLIIVLMLLFAPFLQGCDHLLDFLPIDLPYVPQVPIPEPTPEPEEEPEEPEPEPPPPPPRPGRFTLRHDPGSTMNPILSMNRDNIILSSLIYETLFVLDSNLTVVPVLARNWETEDYITHTIEIYPDIAMHDGSTLTADDVVYSFRQALQRGRFVNRFQPVMSFDILDEHTFNVRLESANSRFTSLLDFPIIKAGSINEPIPPGTGPFIPVGQTELTHLELFNMHRNAAYMPISRIFLISGSDSELTELFDGRVLSLLWDDPASAFDIRLNALHETRFYDTTSLQFIGFNASGLFMRDPDIRRAIGASIERQRIVEEIMPGQSLAAPLPIPSFFQWYNPNWELSHLTPEQEMSYLFHRAGLEDFNNTSYLELRTASGYTRFTVDFIVNIENSHKVQAAHRIARNLRQAGVDITVRELPWDQFLSALNRGEFCMYYGEIMLGGDFDLSPLLLPGPLNFGGTASTRYRMYIDGFLSARGNLEISVATEILLNEIRINAPFAPILYKRHAIYFPLGAISGAQPSQSAIFHNFHNWSIDLYMLSAG